MQVLEGQMKSMTGAELAASSNGLSMTSVYMMRLAEFRNEKALP